MHAMIWQTNKLPDYHAAAGVVCTLESGCQVCCMQSRLLVISTAVTVTLDMAYAPGVLS
jgi:hypothetical protein